MGGANEGNMPPHAMKMKLKTNAMPRGPMARWAVPRGPMTRWARSGGAVVIAGRLAPPASATGHVRAPHSTLTDVIILDITIIIAGANSRRISVECNPICAHF